jgi:predicted ArsR family transcriptional regulator
MQSEAAAVSAGGAGAVDTRSLSSQEILRFLRVHGERSVPRLARDLNIPLETLKHYVKALKARDFVTLRENKRGAVLISSGRPGRRRRGSKQAADPALLHGAQGAMETAG